MQVQRITAADYRMIPRGDSGSDSYVQFTLVVHGKTTYLHTSAYYDPDACLFTEWPAFTVHSRFSQLNHLHRELVGFHRGVALPEFPPKRWLGNKQDSFLRERMRLLTNYFAQLLEIPQLQTSPLLQDFCRPVCELNLAIAGCPEVGKMRLLEGFLYYSPKTYHNTLPTLEQRKASQTSGGMLPFPMDMIVQKRLVRILSVDVVQLGEGSGGEELEKMYEGVVFTYSNGVPESYTLVKRARATCNSSSVVVGLDLAGDPGLASYSAECIGDAFEVFEHLLNDIVSNAFL